ncbi:hypothetical protein BD414DRAFT_490007 [Trametes punicea]|nr:hypothetical protein BD414DRAFT_490007 [Trametes punicea]
MSMIVLPLTDELLCRRMMNTDRRGQITARQKEWDKPSCAQQGTKDALRQREVDLSTTRKVRQRCRALRSVGVFRTAPSTARPPRMSRNSTRASTRPVMQHTRCSVGCRREPPHCALQSPRRTKPGSRNDEYHQLARLC